MKIMHVTTMIYSLLYTFSFKNEFQEMSQLSEQLAFSIYSPQKKMYEPIYSYNKWYTFHPR